MNKINYKSKSKIHKEFEQKVFDFTFKNIEINMREMGLGDVAINKKMKSLVKIFYNMLLNCESYDKKNEDEKLKFLHNYLSLNDDKKEANKTNLVDYFNKYQAFCFDLCLDSVLKGDLNFTYK